MVTGEYPCVRASKITRALRELDWEHDVICKAPPPQLDDSYRQVNFSPYREYDDYIPLIRDSAAEIIHVHNEPYWPVLAAKEATNKPVILNVHDLACARVGYSLDPHEAEAFNQADGLIFVSEPQRQFAIMGGLDVDKPTAILGNYALREFYHDPRGISLPKAGVGEIVYEGGIESRGVPGAWRDLSGISDALEGRLHIMPGGRSVDYGINHPSERDFDMLMVRLNTYDWGITGNFIAHPAWQHSIPNKVFEYMAAGIGILAIDSPAVDEIILPDKLGLKIKRPEDLKNPQLKDPAFIKKIQKNVLRQRDYFAMERQVMVVDRLYNELLGGGE